MIGQHPKLLCARHAGHIRPRELGIKQIQIEHLARRIERDDGRHRMKHALKQRR